MFQRPLEPHVCLFYITCLCASTDNGTHSDEVDLDALALCLVQPLFRKFHVPLRCGGGDQLAKGSSSHGHAAGEHALVPVQGTSKIGGALCEACLYHGVVIECPVDSFTETVNQLGVELVCLGIGIIKLSLSGLSMYCPQLHPQPPRGLNVKGSFQLKIAALLKLHLLKLLLCELLIAIIFQVQLHPLVTFRYNTTRSRIGHVMQCCATARGCGSSCTPQRCPAFVPPLRVDETAPVTDKKRARARSQSPSPGRQRKRH
mmetsp:Transcript_56455/g.143728  ORF Transcript_56455/g.143728 Transcript_56455/m.143728 type:complete len:259 (+) Transcript_56455:271-1047(+)